MKFLIIFLFILKLSAAFINFDRELNSQCKSSFTGADGVCLEAKNCPSFKSNRNDLKICSFKGRVPIVCCPQSLSFRDEKARISARSKNSLENVKN